MKPQYYLLLILVLISSAADSSEPSKSDEASELTPEQQEILDQHFDRVRQWEISEALKFAALAGIVTRPEADQKAEVTVQAVMERAELSRRDAELILEFNRQYESRRISQQRKSRRDTCNSVPQDRRNMADLDAFGDTLDKLQHEHLAKMEKEAEQAMNKMSTKGKQQLFALISDDMLTEAIRGSFPRFKLALRLNPEPIMEAVDEICDKWQQ